MKKNLEDECKCRDRRQREGGFSSLKVPVSTPDIKQTRKKR